MISKASSLMSLYFRLKGRREESVKKNTNAIELIVFSQSDKNAQLQCNRK